MNILCIFTYLIIHIQHSVHNRFDPVRGPPPTWLYVAVADCAALDSDGCCGRQLQHLTGRSKNSLWKSMAPSSYRTFFSSDFWIKGGWR